MTVILRSDASGQSSGVAVLLHGFTRRPHHLAPLSGALQAAGVSTLRVGLGALWWPTSTNNASHLTGVTASIAREAAAEPCVVVGHSAGAAAGAWIAAELRRSGVDVRGLVMVDGVESPTRLIERAWPDLGGVPVRAVAAPPSRCNRDGRLTAWLQGRPDVEIVLVPGSGHGDIEGGPTAIYRWGCGDASSPETRATVTSLTVGFARDLLATPLMPPDR